jgi:hypothetical protein
MGEDSVDDGSKNLGSFRTSGLGRFLFTLAGVVVPAFGALVWFFNGGAPYLLQTTPDAVLIGKVIAGLVASVVAVLLTRRHLFIRGLALGTFGTLIWLTAFSAWLSDSMFLGNSASGGNAGAAAGFQLFYVFITLIVCAVLGAMSVGVLWGIVFAIESQFRVRQPAKTSTEASEVEAAAVVAKPNGDASDKPP